MCIKNFKMFGGLICVALKLMSIETIETRYKIKLTI